MSVSLGKILTCYLIQLDLLKRWIHYRCFNNIKILTVQSCNLYNNKYMIASTQITNHEIFTFTFHNSHSLRYWAVKFCLQAEKIIETVKK